MNSPIYTCPHCMKDHSPKYVCQEEREALARFIAACAKPQPPALLEQGRSR